jgi:DNA-binding NtrC family response regulator
MQALRGLIARVAPTEATVLILGERGTGKELVARAIQQASRRCDRPFITVNCAALPTDLLASELFGHERGAFTGALQRAPGLLAAADSGTVFLDEVGDLPLTAQAMLLRFLQEREVRPLGSTRTMQIDVRLLAATNRDLDAAVKAGEFRADLLDRLREIVVRVPPLCQRRDDIPLLVRTFLRVQSQRHGRAVAGVCREAWQVLAVHLWPGNVRELEQAISRAVVLAKSSVIGPADLDLDTSAGPRGGAPNVPDGIVRLTPRQREALRLAREVGVVRRSDLVARFGVSGEAVRRDLGALVAAGLLRREGNQRGTAYRPVSQGHPTSPGQAGENAQNSGRESLFSSCHPS